MLFRSAQLSGGFQDVCIAEWDATSYTSTMPPCLRRLDGTKHYPEAIVGKVHDDGEIWSAALWQIRGAISAERPLEIFPRVSSPPATPSGAKCANSPCLNLGGQSTVTVNPRFCRMVRIALTSAVE